MPRILPHSIRIGENTGNEIRKRGRGLRRGATACRWNSIGFTDLEQAKKIAEISGGGNVEEGEPLGEGGKGNGGGGAKLTNPTARTDAIAKNTQTAATDDERAAACAFIRRGALMDSDAYFAGSYGLSPKAPNFHEGGEPNACEAFPCCQWGAFLAAVGDQFTRRARR
eukprot:g1438.t1